MDSKALLPVLLSNQIPSSFRMRSAVMEVELFLWVPVEKNTLELSNALRCHGTWLTFLIPLVVVALLRNPVPELGVGRGFLLLKVTVVWQLNQRYQKCRTPRQPESATS